MSSSTLKSDSNSEIGIEQIVFYTHWWRNITDAIRCGKEPGGTASVVRLWNRCRHHGIETHVFVVASESVGGDSVTTELDGVKFHWVSPFLWKTRLWFTNGNATESAWSPFAAVCKLVDIFRLVWASRTQCPNARVHYSMRPAFGITVSILGFLSRGVSVIRHYGVGDSSSHKKVNLIRKLPRSIATKIPVTMHVVTNDGTQGNLLLRELGVPESKICFWPNGIDKDGESHDSLGESTVVGVREDFLLVCAGRLAAIKRQDILIRAMPHLRKVIPNAKLMLVGNGEKFDEYSMLADSLKISDSVEFVGDVPAGEVKNYLKKADVYFQVNRNSNLSATLMEALSVGCCCVVGNTGDLASVLSSDCTKLVDGSSPVEIANVTAKLHDDPDEMQRLRAAALGMSSKLLTWDERLDREIFKIAENSKKRKSE